MLKHILAILIASLLIILAMPYAQHALNMLLSVHQWISDMLVDVFAGGQVGKIIRELIALLFVPVIIGLIPAILYWAMKRSFFPYFMQVVWVVWLIQAGALIIQYKEAILT